MKLFERSGGYWLFWISAVYLALGLWTVFTKTEWIWLQPLWLLFISMPLLFPPLGRWLNLDIGWDRKMGFLNFLGFKKMVEDTADVLEFPESKDNTYVKPQEKEKPATTYYRLGLTDNNRVSLQMGYSEITMNSAGIDNLIQQLELFKKQILEEPINKESSQ